jgi:Bacterial protein of unknown function (DUF899)
MADGVDGTVAHLNARDVTLVFVSQAPLEKLQAYKRRMGWSFPGVSSSGGDFNLDFGFSRSPEQTRTAIAPMLERGVAPIRDHMTRETGTDVVGYLTEGPGFSAFALDDGAVYHTYSATARGLEFLMGYYGISTGLRTAATRAIRLSSGCGDATSTWAGHGPRPSARRSPASPTARGTRRCRGYLRATQRPPR